MPGKPAIERYPVGSSESVAHDPAQTEAEVADLLVLQGISSELIQEQSTEILYEKIVDAAVAIMRSDYASMQMLYPERGSGGELRLLAYRGFNPLAAKFWEWVSATSKSTCGVALSTGKRVVAPDIRTCEFMADSEDQQVYLQTGIHACQTTPLLARSGKAVGMISTHWRTPHQPSERDFRLFDILARQAADLIERTRREEELAQRAALLDLSTDAIIVRNLNGQIVSWNRGAEQLYGWTRNEALGKNIHALLQTQAAVSLEQINQELSQSGYWRGELLHTTRDGRRVTVLCRKVLDRTALGDSGAVMETNTDISERKRAEEQVRRDQHTLAELVEHSPFGMYIVDSQLRIAQMNSGSQTGAFKNVRPAIGRDFGEAIRIPWPEPVATEIVDAFRHTLETGEPYYSRNFISPRSDTGNVESYEWELHRMLLPDGQYGVVCYYFDSTRLRQVEQQLLKTERMVAAGQLAASLAHEINNPLTSVMNILYILTHHPGLDEETNRWATIAETELNRVSRIVKQSLSYYRADAAPRKLELSAVLEESIQIFSDRFKRQGIEIAKRIAPGASIVGFADEVRQVIDNLLLNAAEATPNNGRLAISLRHSRDWSDHNQKGIRLTIADSGCGIPKEHLPRIFQPFFTTKAEKGTGLGLWVVRGIVAKHGGRIRIRSASQGKKTGTVISVLWPSSPQGRRIRRERSEPAA